MKLRFVLTLHSHLPWVLHHGRWPHGTDWLCEAALDSYLPLVAMLDRLDADRISAPITLGITPVLAAQLAEPAFARELDAYLAQRLATVDEAPEALTASGDDALLPLVGFWRDHYRGLRDVWERHERDLIGAFRRHADSGRIDLISSAATHGFLPLLARDESIRLQLLAGRAEHVRHFGDVPRGCWLPECAWRPRGPWQPLPDAPLQPDRAGLETHLQAAGYEWFVVDAHLLDAGPVFDPYGNELPAPAPPAAHSPYRVWPVLRGPRARPLHALVRDPRASAQVWSRHGGYPGDGRYLEFHKLRYPGGLRFWSVTDPTADLGDKVPYRPAAARQAVSAHAHHFHELLDTIAASAGAADRVITAPFDTELFGHWWFEGMEFLDAVYRSFTADDDVRPASGDMVVAAAPPGDAVVRLGAGSWGRNGDWSMWLNPETEWTWRRLWPLEERFWNIAPAALARTDQIPVVEQAARELLLAQSSDWQFIISTGAATDYATKRFTEHCDTLERLVTGLEHPDGDGESLRRYAAACREIDGPFGDLFGAVAAAADVGTA